MGASTDDQALFSSDADGGLNSLATVWLEKRTSWESFRRTTLVRSFRRTTLILPIASLRNMTALNTGVYKVVDVQGHWVSLQDAKGTTEPGWVDASNLQILN